MSAIVDAALRAREAAKLIVDRHTNPNQKAASLTLYGVLANCMALVEQCGDPDKLAELKQEVIALPIQPRKTDAKGRTPRRYIEKGSDAFNVVCRFVFTETDYTNAMRYASALRMASERQIRSDKLAEYLKKNGGVNALYFSRPLDAREVKTKALRLAEQITINRDEPFTLVLKWRTDNSFEVLKLVKTIEVET